MEESVKIKVKTFQRNKQGQRKELSRIETPISNAVICVVLPEDRENIMSIEIELYGEA